MDLSNLDVAEMEVEEMVEVDGGIKLNKNTWNGLGVALICTGVAGLITAGFLL